MRHMYIRVSSYGRYVSHYTGSEVPDEVRDSFSSGRGVWVGGKAWTLEGDIHTAWTTTQQTLDSCWVRVTHPYSSDEPMFANGAAARLARAVALEAEACLP